MILLSFGFGALLSFTVSLQWISFYESVLWHLTIPIGFLFPIGCVAPNPSSLCAKKLKGLGFPHWPRECHLLPTPACLFKWWNSPLIPQNIVGLLIPELVILLSSYSHTWATGYEGSLCLCLQEHHGSPEWSYRLPISVLSLDLTDSPERTKLCWASPMLQGKGERHRPSIFSLSLSLSISCWQIWGIPGLHTLFTCVEPVPMIYLIWSVALHNPNMWSNIFLLEVFPPEAFPVLVKPCNGL